VTEGIAYKVLDEKGRITIPFGFRKAVAIMPGDVVRIALDKDQGCIVISKASVMDYEREDPEMLEACIYAAVRTLTREKKVALAASLLVPVAGSIGM
jgi:bifunctional DNA-binding transcriptional regulator/antitoxin component of YhaV-PrlF toxin-antitoxin module